MAQGQDTEVDEPQADSVSSKFIKTIPYQASSAIVWNIINTRVALTFDRAHKTAEAKEWITMRPYFYATDTVVFDAKGMKIGKVQLVGKTQNANLKYVYKDDELKIWFPNTYTNTDTIQVYLEYKALPYGASSGGSVAITDDKGLYFINTDNRVPNKQAHIWTQGETQSNSHWMITVDKPNTRFTTQIELTVSDSLTTLSNGALISKEVLPGNMRTDIWRMDMPIQAYAVMFAISKYSIVSENWRGKEVSYYVEPEYAPYAANMFRHTTDMMEFFSNRTGVSYPWNKYSQVVVRDYVSGAMENTTASLFGEFINQNNREIADRDYEDVVAHELFHQWFGDYVTCESWSNVTVNESFANYGEQLWRTFKYGKNAGDELAWRDLQGYLASSRQSDPQLVRYNYDSREEVFDAISYNKGGAILRYLNHLIGDAGFDRAMNLYLTRNALRSAEAHQWRLAVEEATGQDWNWFFNQWYFHPGHPVIKINYHYNDTTQLLTVDVRQKQKDSSLTYRLPFKSQVITDGKAIVVDWLLTDSLHTFTYAYIKGKRPVVIPDYLHVLPAEIKEDKEKAEWLAQYIYAKDYVSRRLAIAGASKKLSDSSSMVLFDLALQDAIPGIRNFALSRIENTQSSKYHRRWTKQVTTIASTDDENFVRAAAMDVLGSWKVRAAKPLMFQGLYDSSYSFAGSSLTALSEIDNDTAYHLAKQILKTKQYGALETASWKIIGKAGNPADLAMLQQMAPYVIGKLKITFALSLNSYLRNVDDDHAFEAVAKLYADLIVYETMKQYRSAIAGFLFQAVATQSSKLSGDDKQAAENAKSRLAILKRELSRVVNEEEDKEQKDKFEEMLKDNFK